MSAASALLVGAIDTPGKALGVTIAQAQEKQGKSPADRFYASAYLPLGHWAYPLIDSWVTSGRVTNLEPLIRPYRRIDVARAVLEVSSLPADEVERSWLPALEEEFAFELRALRGEARSNNYGSVYFDAGAGIYSQTFRDLLRAELTGETSETRVLGEVNVDMQGSAGIVAGAFRGSLNQFYKYDAQYFPQSVVPPKNLPLLDTAYMRVEEGYAELQTRYARVSFGRMYHNWGLPGLNGFLRSDYAYSQEGLGYRFGPKKVFLTGAIASFSDFQTDTTHYWSIHRLEIWPIDNLVLSVSEAVVHGGPAQPLVWALVNPVSVWHIATADNDPPHNKLGEVSAWWRPTRGLVLYGSFLADATNLEGSCCQAGGTFAIDLPTLATGLGIRSQFTAIQSLTYRTGLPWELYTVESIGLGWDKIDLYLATVEATWLRGTRWLTPGSTLTLRPRLDLQWRGEQRITDLRPPIDQLPDFPRILSGVTETTVRPAIAGHWRQRVRPIWIDVEFDLGLNFVRNYQNQTDDDRTAFVGNLKVLIETPHWAFGLD